MPRNPHGRAGPAPCARAQQLEVKIRQDERQQLFMGNKVDSSRKVRSRHPSRYNGRYGLRLVG
jgi:hypothetical protein